MDKTLTYFRIFLALLTLLYAGLAVRDIVADLSKSNGFLLADGVSPVGGDFINAFSAGSLAAVGRNSAIYDPQAFMAFERTIIPADIGLRLWAYPPTSLPLVIPFGLLDFQLALAAWSLIGLIVLALGARRIGLSWFDTALLAFSPASLSSIYFGQTGNVAAGLLLVAMAASKPVDMRSSVAAALLTIKPQLGFLLPVLWLIQKRFALIATTAVLVAAFVGVSIVAFGTKSWLDYAYVTLPLLGDLERNGDGPFTAMIPSVFMAVRIVAHDAQLAQWIHLAVATGVVAWVVWRFTQMTDRLQQSAVLLVATAMVTPYIHIYDLAVVFGAGLLHLRRVAGSGRSVKLGAGLAALAAWALPTITVFGNVFNVPLGPPVLLAVLAVVSWPSTTTAMSAGANAVSKSSAPSDPPG